MSKAIIAAALLAGWGATGCGGEALLGEAVEPETCTGGCVMAIAGNGALTRKDGPASQASFQLPRDLGVDRHGRIYVADAFANSIRMIDGDRVVTVAGDERAGYRDGPAAEARFHNPAGIAVTPDGVIFVADADNHRIRKIEDGVVTTVAGSEGGYLDGWALDARFTHPVDVAVGPDGSLFVVDLCNFAIRKIDPHGQVSTLAGHPLEYTIERPRYVSVGPSGTVYFTDGERHLVRMIAPGGTLSTLAGIAMSGMVDGDAASSRFNSPTGIAVDAHERVFIADSNNRRIRLIDRGVVSVVAGTGYIGGENGDALDATFWTPIGLALGNEGQLYVSDTQLANVRQVILPATQRIGTLAQPALAYDPM